MRIETLAVHGGQEEDPLTGAVMTPIYQTATYRQDGVGRPRSGYEYSRTQNPTRTALQKCLAALEGGGYALAFSSGMAATDAALRLLSQGDRVIAGNDVYGGTFRLFDKVLNRFGLAFDFVDTTDPETVADSITPATRMIWLESPTNPYLRITDIAAVAEVVRSRAPGALLVVDNTFATPYLQRPLDLGADLVAYSTTKYLGGHSDVVGGALVTRNAELHERLSFLQNAVGAVPGPLDCFLVLRGLKTLAVRMERHAENAEAVAKYLASQPKVESVNYPFLDGHPQVGIARQQMKNGGGMVSFTLQGGAGAARHVAESTKLFALAESLGGVESLIEVPAAMTHLSVAGSVLEVAPGLVRLSVGIEHQQDLIEDLKQALHSI